MTSASIARKVFVTRNSRFAALNILIGSDGSLGRFHFSIGPTYISCGIMWGASDARISYWKAGSI